MQERYTVDLVALYVLELFYDVFDQSGCEYNSLLGVPEARKDPSTYITLQIERFSPGRNVHVTKVALFDSFITPPPFNYPKECLWGYVKTL